MEVAPVAAKRQMVLGEPRNKSRTESKLFLVRKLQQSDAVIGDTLVDSRSDGKVWWFSFPKISKMDDFYNLLFWFCYPGSERNLVMISTF